jgi:hypothetical protein
MPASRNQFYFNIVLYNFKNQGCFCNVIFLETGTFDSLGFILGLIHYWVLFVDLVKTKCKSYYDRF